MHRVPVAVAGEPQRHFYLANVPRLIRRLRPGIAFIEQEPFAIPALQWGWCLHRMGIPFGLQADENLDRPFPWPAKVIRRWLLPRTSWINARIEIRRRIPNERVRDEGYAEMDVLAVPSRTTRTWAEQFGRVLVEAMLCGRPVVGYDSGEIGWVIRTAGGGDVVPEGDVAGLAGALERMRSPERRAELAARGRAGAERHFGVAAAATALEDLLTGRAGT